MEKKWRKNCSSIESIEMCFLQNIQLCLLTKHHSLCYLAAAGAAHLGACFMVVWNVFLDLCLFDTAVNIGPAQNPWIVKIHEKRETEFQVTTVLRFKDIARIIYCDNPSWQAHTHTGSICQRRRIMRATEKWTHVMISINAAHPLLVH